MSDAIILRPTRDLAWLNETVRRPEIYDRIRRDGDVEASAFSVEDKLQHPDHQFVRVDKNGQGVGFFHTVRKAPGIYEVHTNLTNDCRGSDALVAGRGGMALMFTRTDCRKLISYAPANIPEALAFSLQIGFKRDFIQAKKWPRDHQRHDLQFVSLTIQEWIRKAHPDYAPIGEHFHQQLFSQLPHPLHAEDANHNGMVGLCCDIAIGGQLPEKAEAIYNEWAAQAGYEPGRYLGTRNGWQHWDIRDALVAMDANFNLQLVRSLLCQQQGQ